MQTFLFTFYFGFLLSITQMLIENKGFQKSQTKRFVKTFNLKIENINI